MKLSARYAVPAALALAALLCILAAAGAALVIENRSAASVRTALAAAGHDWATVTPDGLKIILTGTAPTEARRFNALAVAGNQVDSARLRDRIEVAAPAEVKAPDFTLEMLRNAEGLSLIGLVPATTDRADMVERLTPLAEGGKVADLLESADHPAPKGWDAAVRFALEAISLTPRAKVSVDPGRVAITAITDSPDEKTRLERALRRSAPSAVALTLTIEAPHPVIAPFTLRFLSDGKTARFDACSADNEAARDRILAAARAAGAQGQPGCTIGLGVPTPEWAAAVELGIAAVKEIGRGSVTFSDADVAFSADAGVSQAVFDRAVGELESNLPDVFSLRAHLTPSDSQVQQGPAEFSASLAENGGVQLRGRLPDALTRDAVDSFARARFGSADVYAATRLDAGLPPGWPVRVMAAIESLSELAQGEVTVKQDSISITGVSGKADASDRIARILSSKLGETAAFAIDVRYDERFDPAAGLPTAEECERDINGALAVRKITFEPGSATITRDADATLDKIAALMKTCSDYPMEVGGHTDSQGREEMNQSLSQDRAQAVIAALQARRALTGKLTAVGYGESRPLADNDSEEGREKNRRIEFRLPGSAAATGGDGSGDTADGAATPVAAEGTVAVQTPGDTTIRPAKRPTRAGETAGGD